MESQGNTSKELLSYLFDFANFDIGTLNQDTLPVLAMAYVRFAYYEDPSSSSAKYSAFTSAAFDSSGEKMSSTKEFLAELQKHFIGILDNIIESSGSGLALNQKGTRRVSIIDGEFVESFLTETPPMDDFDLQSEKRFAEASLTDIIINGNLLPEMFSKCKGCESYFYQNTKREMKFCSTKCSNRYRQRNFKEVGHTGSGMTKDEIDSMHKTMTKKAKKGQI